MVRPTKLTPARQQIICEAVRRGESPSRADELAGLPHGCSKYWLAQGLLGREPFKTFRDAYQEAKAEFHAEVSKQIRDYHAQQSHIRELEERVAALQRQASQGISARLS